jgi:hypothetical protein
LIAWRCGSHCSVQLFRFLIVGVRVIIRHCVAAEIAGPAVARSPAGRHCFCLSSCLTYLAFVTACRPSWMRTITAPSALNRSTQLHRTGWHPNPGFFPAFSVWCCFAAQVPAEQDVVGLHLCFARHEAGLPVKSRALGEDSRFGLGSGRLTLRLVPQVQAEVYSWQCHHIVGMTAIHLNLYEEGVRALLHASQQQVRFLLALVCCLRSTPCLVAWRRSSRVSAGFVDGMRQLVCLRLNPCADRLLRLGRSRTTA